MYLCATEMCLDERKEKDWKLILKLAVDGYHANFLWYTVYKQQFYFYEQGLPNPTYHI